nr:alcohol dehydrogenase-like 4 [Coffea arabica]
MVFFVCFEAVVVYSLGQPLVIQDVLADPPKKMEVRIQILCTSICHTDLGAWLGTNEAQRVYSRILGHEASGWNQLKIDGVFVVMPKGSHFIGKFGSYCKFFLLVRDENLLICAQENLSSLYLLGICYVSTCY